MHDPVHDRLVYIHVAVADLQIETAFGIRAYPGLEVNSSALTSEIGEGNQIAHLALLALREAIYLIHEAHLPTVIRPKFPRSIHHQRIVDNGESRPRRNGRGPVGPPI